MGQGPRYVFSCALSYVRVRSTLLDYLAYRLNVLVGDRWLLQAFHSASTSSVRWATLRDRRWDKASCRFSRSVRMRSSSTDAGSSLGSCGTSLPSKARFKMDWRSLFALAMLDDSTSIAFA